MDQWSPNPNLSNASPLTENARVISAMIPLLEGGTEDFPELAFSELSMYWRERKTPGSGSPSRRSVQQSRPPVIYTSDSIALAQLEILVQLPTDRLLASYAAFRTGILGASTKTLGREERLENCPPSSSR